MSICIGCGCEYVCPDTYREYDACDQCNTTFLRESGKIPKGLESIAISYQFDFNCFAKYQAIWRLYPNDPSERDRLTADLIEEYKAKQQQLADKQRASQQIVAKQEAENLQRLRDMHKI